MSAPPAKRLHLVIESAPVSTKGKGDSKSPIVEIHATGDAVLLVGSGEEAKSIRVASQALTVASNFFVGLFTANLHENKLTFSPQCPKQVPMVDDDPGTMLGLCNILHHRSENVKVTNGKALLDLAYICAKYDCIAAVRLWMSTQLDKQFRILKSSAHPTESETTTLSALDIMGLAYLFDFPERFWHASRPLSATGHLSTSLLTYLPQELIGKRSLVLEDFCFNGAWLANRLQKSVSIPLADCDMAGCLDSRRNDTMAAICYDAEMAVAEILNKAPSCPGVSLTGLNEGGKKKSLCHQAVLRLGFYMGCLGSVGLWPVRDYDRMPSVEETLETLAAVSREIPPKKCGKFWCNACRDDVEEDLMKVVEKHKKELVGLCLGCIKGGNYSRDAFRESCLEHGLGVGE